MGAIGLAVLVPIALGVGVGTDAGAELVSGEDYRRVLAGGSPMPYVGGRIIHDADAHIMEPPTWLRDHADPGIRDRIEPLQLTSGNELRQTGDPDEQLRDLVATFDRLAQRHASPEYQAAEADEIMSRK